MVHFYLSAVHKIPGTHIITYSIFRFHLNCCSYRYGGNFMKPLLEVRDVSLSYHTPSGETAALSHISFDLMPGEFLAVVGPSGCGKSTLLNVICGLLAPEQGSVLMNGTSVSRGDPRMGYMLQKDHLLEWRTIYKNVLLGLEVRRELTPEKLSYIEKNASHLRFGQIPFCPSLSVIRWNAPEGSPDTYPCAEAGASAS